MKTSPADKTICGIFFALKRRKAMKKEKPYLKDEEYDKFDHLKVSSASDCTGLITVPPENEDELENYADLYDYGPTPFGEKHF